MSSLFINVAIWKVWGRYRNVATNTGRFKWCDRICETFGEWQPFWATIQRNIDYIRYMIYVIRPTSVILIWWIAASISKILRHWSQQHGKAWTMCILFVHCTAHLTSLNVQVYHRINFERYFFNGITMCSEPPYLWYTKHILITAMRLWICVCDHRVSLYVFS